MTFEDLNSEKELRQLCTEYGVRKLYIFGSATRGDLKKGSDIDFIVHFDDKQIKGAFDRYMDFRSELERLYGRNIDLYHTSNFRNKIFQQEVDKTKKLVYAA